MDREQALLAYQQAWAGRTEDQVSSALARCLAVSSTYQNPITDLVRGVEGLTSLILDVPVMFPGAAVNYAEAADLHHDVACFSWQLSSTVRIRIMGRDYGRALDGIDLVEFDVDNRIQRVTAFFGFHRQPPRRTPADLALDAELDLSHRTPALTDLRLTSARRQTVG